MKSVLVTGASTGIGKACVHILLNSGWRVFAGVRKEQDAEKLKQESKNRAIPIFLDVTQPESIQDAASIITTQIGSEGFHGLVNNAGIAVACPLEAIPIEDIRKQFEVNVFGQLSVIQAFINLLRASKGRIVNIGSISGRMAIPFTGPYCSSKFALEAITDSLRMELKPWEIQVSIIEPGRIVTPIWEKSNEAAIDLENRIDPEKTALYRPYIDRFRKIILKTAARGGTPESVADAVIHALEASKPKTRYVVGQDAKIQAFLAKFIPDKIRDNLVLKNLKLNEI
ncbi:MAG: SDR family oxidoreductase [Bacteroidia bacterium]|nr:SDR family oxidoreductase [Bacteroidia bacterium]